MRLLLLLNFAVCLLQVRQINGQPMTGPLPTLTPAQSPSGLSTLPELPAYEVVQLLCARNITAVDYVEALLDRYDNGGYECLNMWTTFNATQVLEDAASIDAKYDAGESIEPLCGLPLAVKDSIDVMGFPTTAATPALADSYPIAQPPLIQQYLDANGIIMGKTNLGEMQDTITSINPNYPNNGIYTPLNPWDVTRIPGGSSGGSATVLSSRTAPFALCEDTGGSCRAPAHAQLIFGLRPSLGAYDVADGLVPAYLSTDTPGSMARTAEDLILLDSIVRKPNCTTDAKGALASPVSCDVTIDRDMNLSSIVIGLPSTFGWADGLSTEIAGVVNDAIIKLRAAGVKLVPFDSSAVDEAQAALWPGNPGGDPEAAYEVGLTTARWLLRRNSTLSFPELVSELNRPSTHAEYEGYISNFGADTVQGSDSSYFNYIKNTRPAFVKAWMDAIEGNDFDAVLYPGWRTAITRIDAGDSYNVLVNTSGTFLLPYYSDSGSTGLSYYDADAGADMTVGAFPLGLGADGTPVGLQVAAVPGNDETVLSLLLAFEQVLGPMPAPPLIAQCKGCQANVSNVVPTYDGTEDLNSTSVWANFALTFSGGSCYKSSLDTYGLKGPYGVGLVGNATANVTVDNVVPVAMTPTQILASSG